MERSAFELSQRTTLAAEVKSVLDSWVRYEGAEREEQQRALSASVIQSVMKSLQEEKTQKSILEDAVSEIESECLERKNEGNEGRKIGGLETVFLFGEACKNWTNDRSYVYLAFWFVMFLKSYSLFPSLSLRTRQEQGYLNFNSFGMGI